MVTQFTMELTEVIDNKGAPGSLYEYEFVWPVSVRALKVLKVPVEESSDSTFGDSGRAVDRNLKPVADFGC